MAEMIISAYFRQISVRKVPYLREYSHCASYEYVRMLPGLRFPVNRSRMKPYNGFTYDFYDGNDNFGLFSANFSTESTVSPGILMLCII